PDNTSIRRAELTVSNQIWDNTLTYNDSFGNHNFKIMLGSSFRDEQSNTFAATGNNVQGIALESSWYLNFANPSRFANQVEEIGDRLYSLACFGRLEYSYKEKYLLNATVRSEGDSRFPREIWKTTAQFGVGCVISEANFMPENGFIDFLKLRGSWGELANGALGGSAGTRTITQTTVD